MSVLEPGCEDGNEQSVSATNLVGEDSKDQAAKCEAQHEAGPSHRHPDLTCFNMYQLHSIKDWMTSRDLSQTMSNSVTRVDSILNGA